MVSLNLCEYGCDQEAKYQFKNGKWCCSESKNSCLSLRKLNSGKNIGKEHTEETRRKISEGNKGKIISEKQKIKQRKSMIGKTWSEDRRKKIMDYIYKSGGPMLGKKHSLDSKRKMSENTKGCKHTNKTKEKISLKNKGKQFSIETKNKMSKSAKIRSLDPASYFNSKEFRKILKDKMLNGQASYMNTFIKNPSKPQLKLYKMILEICPYAILNYPCLNYSIDIAIPFLNIAFEYDGSYWHKDSEYDSNRDNKLKEDGWKIFRFKDIIPNEEEINKLLRKI